jgi:ESS family glutamate:Na+ symporter
MEKLTYHCLGLGFIALSLKAGVKTKDENRLVVLDSGLITVNTYLVQAIIGLSITILLSVTVMKNLFPAAGLLLPMGFGQGTGQALNIGSVYQGYGFEQGIAFGLAIAAIGFIVACVTGVIYMNYLKNKGELRVQMQRKEESSLLNSNIYEKDETPLNESVDKLTMQIAFVGIVYLATYLVILGASYLATTYLGNFGANTIRPLLWGFNFLFGSLFAIMLKKILLKLHRKKIYPRINFKE